MRLLIKIIKIVGFGTLAVIGGLLLLLARPYKVADDPTLLMMAARQGDVEQTRLLLAQGANVDERRGCSTRYGIFIAHGPSTPTCDDTALLAAIQGRNLETLQMLLDAGADLSVRDDHKSGVWEYATSSLSVPSDSEVVYLLAKHTPPSITEVDRLLYRDLGDRKLLEFALARPHSPAAREAVLCGSARRGDLETMQRLLETFETVPPKSLACAIGVPYNIRRPSVELLLNRGVDPNGDAESGLHPLSSVILTMMIPGTASQSVPPEVQDLLELLLRHGSDPRLARNGGVSAIALARVHGHEAAAVLLENWRP